MSRETTSPLVLRLSCTDIAASRQFYTDVLGFELKHGYPGGDPYTSQQECAVADPDGYGLRFVQKIGSRIAPPSTGRVCK